MMSVLVVVSVVGSVAVTIMDVVEVIVVDDGLVPTGLAVGVRVVVVLDVREGVLVVVTIVAGMSVAVVDVVDMVVVVDSGVAAAGSVFVGVVGMCGVIGGGHVCSLEWVIASETM
jgi:hypothetical protein